MYIKACILIILPEFPDTRIALGEHVSCIIGKFCLLQARRTFLLYKKTGAQNISCTS